MPPTGRLWIRLAAIFLLSMLWLLTPANTRASSGWVLLTHTLNAARYVNPGTTAPCLNSTTQLCIYAIAGNTGPNPLANVEFADPSTSSDPLWTGSGDNVNTLNGNADNASGRLYDPAAATGPCLSPDTDQCIYVVGGNPTGNPGGEVNDIEMVDPSSGVDPSWSTISAHLAQSRYEGAAVSAPCLGSSGLSTAPQCIYVIAGHAGQPGGPITSVETLDPNVASPSWTAAPSLQTARYDLGATTAPCPGSSGLLATAKLCIYAVGGISSVEADLASVEVLDPSAGAPAWQFTTSMTTVREGPAVLTAPCPGTTGLANDAQCVYVVAGDSTGSTTVEVLQPSSGSSPSWVAGPSLNQGRFFYSGATAPCPGTSGQASSRLCLYAAGGFLSGIERSSVEVLDPSASPTRSPLSAIHVQRHITRLLVSWRVADASGVLGFNVYVGDHRINPHLIRVHRSPTYRIALHTALIGRVTVRAISTHGGD
jgi:hypothetical protein